MFQGVGSPNRGVSLSDLRRGHVPFPNRFGALLLPEGVVHIAAWGRPLKSEEFHVQTPLGVADHRLLDHLYRLWPAHPTNPVLPVGRHPSLAEVAEHPLVAVVTRRPVLIAVPPTPGAARRGVTPFFMPGYDRTRTYTVAQHTPGEEECLLACSSDHSCPSSIEISYETLDGVLFGHEHHITLPWPEPWFAGPFALHQYGYKTLDQDHVVLVVKSAR